MPVMLSRKAEDYLEAILNISLQEGKGYARVKEIARALNVKPSSVVEMVNRLNGVGLVNYKKYEGITLTPKGEKVARVVKDRHETIRAFLAVSYTHLTLPTKRIV